MSCAEVRSLLPFRPLDALEEDEVGFVDGHLSSCAACSKTALAYDEALDVLRERDSPAKADGDDAFPGSPLFEKIVGRVALSEASPAPPAPDLAIALVCSFCKDALGREEACYCASCLAPHHQDCFRSHGRCSAYGCDETRTVRPTLDGAVSPALPRPASPRPATRSRRGTILALVGAIAVGGWVAALSWTSFTGASVADGTGANFTLTTRKAAPPPAVRPSNPPPPAPPKLKDLPKEFKDAFTFQVLEYLSDCLGAEVVALPGVPERTSIRFADDADASSALTRLCAQLKCYTVGIGELTVLYSSDEPVLGETKTADVRKLLEELGASGGMNVLVAPDVGGTMNLDLQGLTWRRAFSTILDACGLKTSGQDGVGVVAAHELAWGSSDWDRPAPTVGFEPLPDSPEKRIEISLHGASPAAMVPIFATQAGVRLTVQTGRDAPSMSFSVRKAPWRDLLCYVASAGGYTIEQTSPTGVVLKARPPREKERSIRCVHGHAGSLFRLLAKRAGKPFVISPEVRTQVTNVALHGVSAETALGAIADAYGYRVDDRDGVLTIGTFQNTNPKVETQGGAFSTQSRAIRAASSNVRSLYAPRLGAIVFEPTDPARSEALVDAPSGAQVPVRVGDSLELDANSVANGNPANEKVRSRVVEIAERAIVLELDEGKDGKERLELSLDD